MLDVGTGTGIWAIEFGRLVILSNAFEHHDSNTGPGDLYPEAIVSIRNDSASELMTVRSPELISVPYNRHCRCALEKSYQLKHTMGQTDSII